MKYVKTFDSYINESSELKNSLDAWQADSSGTGPDVDLMDAVDKYNKSNYEFEEAGDSDDYAEFIYYNDGDIATLNAGPAKKGFTASFSSDLGKDVKEFSAKSLDEIAKKFAKYLKDI